MDEGVIRVCTTTKDSEEFVAFKQNMGLEMDYVKIVVVEGGSDDELLADEAPREVPHQFREPRTRLKYAEATKAVSRSPTRKETDSKTTNEFSFVEELYRGKIMPGGGLLTVPTYLNHKITRNIRSIKDAIDKLDDNNKKKNKRNNNKTHFCSSLTFPFICRNSNECYLAASCHQLRLPRHVFYRNFDNFYTFYTEYSVNGRPVLKKLSNHMSGYFGKMLKSGSKNEYYAVDCILLTIDRQELSESYFDMAILHPYEENYLSVKIYCGDPNFLIGKEVFKYGYTTGYTQGKIERFENINVRGTLCQGYFVIKPVDPYRVFANHGDSGGPIVAQYNGQYYLVAIVAQKWPVNPTYTCGISLNHNRMFMSHRLRQNLELADSETIRDLFENRQTIEENPDSGTASPSPINTGSMSNINVPHEITRPLVDGHVPVSTECTESPLEEGINPLPPQPHSENMDMPITRPRTEANITQNTEASDANLQANTQAEQSLFENQELENPLAGILGACFKIAMDD